jgi:hypothetical protein
MNCSYWKLREPGLFSFNSAVCSLLSHLEEEEKEKEEEEEEQQQQQEEEKAGF